MNMLKELLSRSREQQSKTVALEADHPSESERQQVYEKLERERVHANASPACSPLVRWAKGEAALSAAGTANK